MFRFRSLALAAVIIASLVGQTACEPKPVTCKTSLFKYDHKTAFITWFTLYNEMRFCYDGSRAVNIEWANNRTSQPTPGYTRGSVRSTTVIESYEGSKRRARNLSVHEINCLRVLNGFDVTLRQFGYGSGKVTQWRSDINNATDC